MCHLSRPGRCQSSPMEMQQNQSVFCVSHGRVSVLGGPIERVLRRDAVIRSLLLTDVVASCNHQTTIFSTPLQRFKLDVWIAYAGASSKTNWSFVEQLADGQLANALEARSTFRPNKSCLQHFCMMRFGEAVCGMPESSLRGGVSDCCAVFHPFSLIAREQPHTGC